MHQRSVRFVTLAMAVLTVAGLAIAPADARRGGNFGSRGSRTYSAPRATFGSDRTVAPVQRSMTARPAAQAAPAQSGAFGTAAARPAGSRFGGFGGGLIGGLIAGGLLGHLLGGGNGGWGSSGGGGFLMTLIQIAILGGIAWFVIGLFRRRKDAQAMPSPAQMQGQSMRDTFSTPTGYAPAPAATPWGGGQTAPPAPADTGVDIDLTPADQDAFERLLIDVQEAFGREDYARLRQLTTPEIMSYLSEELSQNATQGLRNEVSGTRLIDAEVSEAWREAGGDYATVAMRFESVDVMRNRTTGAIASGSTTPTQTTELWTFLRDASAVWKLSAIQDG